MNDPITVIFRRDSSGEITAVFPTEPADVYGRYMTCYAHVGQHGSCSMEWYQTTKPAALPQYSALADELRRLGYVLHIVQRISPKARKDFNVKVSQMREAEASAKYLAEEARKYLNKC